MNTKQANGNLPTNKRSLLNGMLGLSAKTHCGNKPHTTFILQNTRTAINARFIRLCLSSRLPMTSRAVTYYEFAARRCLLDDELNIWFEVCGRIPKAPYHTKIECGPRDTTYCGTNKIFVHSRKTGFTHAKYSNGPCT